MTNYAQNSASTESQNPGIPGFTSLSAKWHLNLFGHFCINGLDSDVQEWIYALKSGDVAQEQNHNEQ